VRFTVLSFQLLDHRLRLGNVFGLGGLVTATKRNYHHIPFAPAIHAVAGAKVNAQLYNLASDWLAIAPMSKRQTRKPSQNLPLPNFVAQSLEPIVKGRST